MRGALQEDPAHYARGLRKRSTDAERKLWARLRNRQFGPKFRRQHPVGPYVADFCCPELRLIIELDGGQHAAQVKGDARRSRFLQSNGYRVLRFWNTDVLGNVEGVLERIARTLRDPHPSPLPGREREGRARAIVGDEPLGGRTPRRGRPPPARPRGPSARGVGDE